MTKQIETGAGSPQNAPKSFDELKSLLDQQKGSMSTEDYARISADIEASKGLGIANMDSYFRIRLPMIQSEIDSAKRQYKAEQDGKAVKAVKAPAQAAAAQGDTKAAAALTTVATAEAQKGTEKAKAAASVTAEVPPKTKALKTALELSSTKILHDLRTQFDEKLNFNDALDVLLKNRTEFAKYNSDSTYLQKNAESPLTKFLDDIGYVARTRFNNGENNYSTAELQAILGLRDAITDDVYQKLSSQVQIQRSVKIDASLEKDSPAKKMLAELLDFNKDGNLTAYNQKERSSNVLIGGFQKLLDLGKDTQMVVAPELMAYQAFSSKIRNPEDVYALIANRVGKSVEEVKASWADEKKKPLLIEAFQRVYLQEVTQSNTTVASKVDAKADIARYQVEKVNEQAKQLNRIKDALKNEGFVGRVREQLTGAGLPELDATNMQTLLEQTALRVYEINPQIFGSIGVNAAVNENILRTTERTFNDHTTTTTTNTRRQERQTVTTIIRDIRVVQDANGNVVSRTVTGQRPGGTSVQTVDRGTTSTSTSSTTRTQTGETTTEKRERDTKLNPTLVIGLNQDIFGYKSERFNAQAGVGASAVASVDGIVFPISASVSGNFTAANNNATLQSSALDGNFVLGARLSVSKPLNGKNKDAVPSIGFDINPNDKLNAMEKQQVRLEGLLEKIAIKQDGTMDVTALETELKKNEEEANKKDPKDINMLSEISLMRRFLADTSKVLEGITIPTDEAPDNLRTKRLLLIKNNMTAYKNAYKEAILLNNQGYSVAGLNITFIPGISAVFLGLNVQNIVAKARKTGVDSVEANLNAKGLTLAEVNAFYKDAVQLDKADPAALLVKLDAINKGYVTIGEGIGMNKIYQDPMKITPMEGHRLQFRKVEHRTAEGLTVRGVVIDQVPVQTVAKPQPTVIPASPEKGTTIEGVYNNTQFTKQERDQLFMLSRTDKNLIGALNDIIAGKYSDARAKILMAGPKLHFVASKLSNIRIEFAEQDKKVLNNLILATSGSRNVRDASELTFGQMVSEQKKNERAFIGLLPKSLDSAAVNEYKQLQAGLNTTNNPKEKVPTAPLSSLVGAGYRDISGTVSFSQIGSVDGANKRTLAGLFRFSGDMQVFGKASEVTQASTKAMILEDSKKSGAFDRNLYSTNEFLKQNGIAPEARFSPQEFEQYMLTGELPKKLSALVEISNKPKYLLTRAALPGATCFNDVFAVAFPLITVKGRTQESAPPLVDRSPEGTFVSTSDLLEQNGGGSSGTLGMNFSKTVVEQVTNAVVDKVTTSSSQNTVNRNETTDTSRTQYVDNVTTVRPGQGTSTTVPGSAPADPNAPVTGTGATPTF